MAPRSNKTPHRIRACRRDTALLLYIVIDYPGPCENIVVSCPKAPPETLPNGLWTRGWLVLHPDEMKAGFTDFKMVKNGPLWAQKTLKNHEVRFVREDLDLRLIHVPQ